MIHPIRETCACIAVAMSALLATNARADDVLKLDLGAYQFDSSTEIGITGPRIGTRFELEELGVDGAGSRETVPRAEAYIRPFERHRLRLMYVETEPRRTISLDPILVSATARVQLRRVEADYLYSFWKSEAAEVAAAIGYHSSRFDASIRSPELGIGAETDGFQAVPTIGLHGTWHFTPKWELSAHVYGMPEQFDDKDRSLLAYRVVTRYFFWRNVGVGLGVSGVRYDLQRTRQFVRADLDLSINGAELFLALRF